MLSSSFSEAHANLEPLSDFGAMVHVRVHGSLTEDAVLYECLANVTDQDIVLDCEDVTRINSCGVRDWVRWMQALEQRKNRVFLRRCSPALVAQFNMIRNFTGQAHVLSILAPFICESCQRESTQVFATQEMPPGFIPVSPPCPQCGTDMTFDEIPESYFDFVERHAKRFIPEHVAAALAKS